MRLLADVRPASFSRDDSRRRARGRATQALCHHSMVAPRARSNSADARRSAPVRRLTRAAERIAATRDLRSRVGDGRGDELGRLAKAFDIMLDALATSVDAQRQLTNCRITDDVLEAGGTEERDVSHASIVAEGAG